LGAAYSPDFSNGLLHMIFGSHGNSSIRAGYGMHYTNIEGYNDWNLSALPYGLFYGSQQKIQFSKPFIVRATGQQLPQPFPLLNGTNNTTFNFASHLPMGPYRYPLFHSPSPYEEHVDLTFERALTSKTLMSLSYVGAFGHHLTVNANSNPGNPALCQSLSQASEVTDGTTCGPGGENTIYHPVGGGEIDGTREPIFGNNFKGLGLELNEGNSAYNSLQSTLRYTTDRLNFRVGYTWSKAIDNGSGRGDQIFLYGDHNHFRNISIYDSRNNFVANYSYELPFDKVLHFNERITRGWKISGITQFAQGVPVIMSEQSDDNSEVGDQSVSPWCCRTDEPVYTPGNIVGDHNPRHGNPWFNTSLFSPEAYGQQGNSPRRFFNGPGRDNTDVAMSKAVKIRGNMSAEFRAEFYNALNHVQFNGLYEVDGEIGDQGSGFGYVGGDNGARMGQFSMKFNF
jgi:hypothetical protein